MIFKNLFRRKTRTLLTILGIAVGVASIIGLGALADGMQTGYTNMLSGSKADLVLSQPDAFDIAFSSIDEEIGPALAVMPEIKNVSAMIEGYSSSEDQTLLIVFGYPDGSFSLERYQLVEGQMLSEAKSSGVRGKPVMLGSAASESLKKGVGDNIRLVSSTYRVVGIYQTGDAFEDSAVLLPMREAQELLGKSRQVSLFYIQLKDPSLKQRLVDRVQRQWPKLQLTGANEYANKQSMIDMMRGMMWVISILAIIIGGVSMMNSQLMSVFERTREIGVLRSVGWSSGRVLRMILSESLLVCLAGGLIGIVMGYGLLTWLQSLIMMFGTGISTVRPSLILQALMVVLLLGVTGGLYPAWKASRLQPVEALRYEGGSGSRVHRLPFGGMAVQSLWQRSTRTILTMLAISLTVGSILALDGIVKGFGKAFTDSMFTTQAEVILRQSNIGDTSLSTIDERTADKITVMPEVKSVSGVMFNFITDPQTGAFFILQGYAPNEFAIQRFQIVDGKMLNGNRQIMLGRTLADSMNKGIGETVDFGGIRYRIEGIYESNVGWEQMGGVISLRDSQIAAGKPRKLMMLAVKLRDPSQASALVAKINRDFPEVYAALGGDFADQLPDMQKSKSMTTSISILAILLGGVGVLNTMLMVVMERTREIGVLRAMGWRRRRVLVLILQESGYLGIGGGILGIIVALGMGGLMSTIPGLFGAFGLVWTWDSLLRTIVIALVLGLLGGFYPALRATRLQPTEALRYE
jgi:ABC-type antimicrobial peptide transport system permease subunit